VAQGGKYTLRVNGKDVASRTTDNFDTTPREDLVLSMLRERGLNADKGTALDLANKPLEAAKWRLSQNVSMDTYIDFAENLKSELGQAGEDIGAAFAEGIVPDIGTVDSHLDALRRLKLYDPEEYQRQGAEGAEEYLISLQNALDAYEAAKIAYVAEPNENTLSDFEKTLGQLQDVADNNPLKLKADTSDLYSEVYKAWSIGQDTASLGITDPLKFLKYANSQILSQISGYSDKGMAVPKDSDTYKALSAILAGFKELYSKNQLNAQDRITATLLERALNRPGGSEWIDLYRYTGTLKDDTSQAGRQFISSTQTAARPIQDGTLSLRSATADHGRQIVAIGSIAKKDVTDGTSYLKSGSQIGGSAIQSGGQQGGSAVLAGCQAGAAALGVAVSSMTDYTKKGSYYDPSQFKFPQPTSSSALSAIIPGLVEEPWQTLLGEFNYNTAKPSLDSIDKSSTKGNSLLDTGFGLTNDNLNQILSCGYGIQSALANFSPLYGGSSYGGGGYGSEALNSQGTFGGRYGSNFNGWYTGGVGGLQEHLGGGATDPTGWMSEAARRIGGAGAMQVSRSQYQNTSYVPQYNGLVESSNAYWQSLTQQYSSVLTGTTRTTQQATRSVDDMGCALSNLANYTESLPGMFYDSYIGPSDQYASSARKVESAVQSASAALNSFYPLLGAFQQTAYDSSKAISLTAEAWGDMGGDGGWLPCALSDFADWQETTAGLFYPSYIGPTSGYPGSPGGGSPYITDWGGWSPSFADEGYVASPTLAKIGDRPGGEYVVGASRFENAVSKMGSGEISITINSPLTVQGGDASAFEAILERRNRELVEQITEQIAVANSRQ